MSGKPILRNVRSLAVGSYYPRFATKIRVTAALGEEPEIELALV